ncbi:MAG: hypothetical protein V3U92_12940 [Cellulophaga sp.]
MKKTPIIKSQSRRDFFIKAALTGIAASLPPMLLNSCEDKIKFQGTGKAPFKIWEEMLQAIKTSPDYLSERVKDLITAKNPEAMYNFVKNKIVLIPTTTNAISYYNLGNGIKWGIEGVLRCGMATPREKAELLHQMYQKAEIASKVVYERTSIKAEDVPAFFYRPIDREFNPEISNRQFKQWEKAMRGPEGEVQQKELIIDYTKDAKDLASSIVETLPQIDDFGSPFNFKWDNYKTPTVEFTHNNKMQYAHLFDPKTPFGKKHNSSKGQIVKAEPIQKNKEKVSLKITYRDTVDHKIEKDLIKGEWNAIDLIGKQIQLSFLHGLTLEEQVVTSIGSLRVFTPVLALQAIDEDLEFVEKRSFIADPITIDGKRILVSSEKKLGANGSELLPKPHPELQKEVQNLGVIPKASGYPIVKLSIDATNALGKRIEGLSATDFKITDNGKPVRALLENNQRTPKILVLSDGSGSMPAAYTNKRMKKFNSTLKQKIKEEYPAAIVEFWRTTSELFTWLLKASQTNYDLILFATDGDNRDSFEEKMAPIYKVGPPCIILNVDDAKKGYYMKTFNKMAEITSGIVLNAKDQEKVLEEVTSYIENMKMSPYVFTYASADKTKPHSVKVTLDNERIKATGNYTFPTIELEQKNGISGMYLELKIGNKKPINRVLTGWDPIAGYYTKPDSKDVDAVQQLLLGGVMLAVEGEGPTLAVALADLLKSKLSNRKWGEAYLDNDIKKATKELSKGSIHIPSILIPMLGPLQNQVTSKSITYPNGYRMCLLKTLVGINQPSKFTFDYLPTSDYMSMAKDKKERFITTLEKTAQLAVREGTLFQQSTYIALRGAKCIDSRTANAKDWRYSVMDYNHKDFQYWNEKVLSGQRDTTTIFDITANAKSFWQIGNKTGEIYGILPDGSGGGGERFNKQLEELSRVVDTYMLLFNLLGYGTLALSVVATYGKTLFKLYAIATEAIIIMDTTGVDDEIKKALQQLACNIAKDISFGLSSLPGAAGQIGTGIEFLIGNMAPKHHPFSC